MRHVVVLCSLLVSMQASGQSDAASGAIYYFNSPESVRTPGTLGEVLLPAGKPARLFFHFVNKTGRAQAFSVISSGNWCAGRSGFGLSMDPGRAGLEAVKRFFSRNSSAPSGIQVQPGETISGIVDCLPTSNARVVCAMGSGPTQWKVEVANNTLEIHDADLAVGHTAMTFGTDKPGSVQGAYGTTMRLRFHNRTKKTLHVTVSVSPRGGALSFLYLFNGSVSITDKISARATKHLFQTAVLPGSFISIDTIPTGGFSYPVKVTASVLQ